MSKYTTDQWSYVSHKLWNDMDRIFSKNPKKFIESMTAHDKLNYFLNKRQVIASVLTWWQFENLEPLFFRAPRSIEFTKRQAFAGFLESLEKKSDCCQRLLTIAMTNMLVVPNILQITESSGPKEKFDQYKSYISLIKTGIGECVKVGSKYSDMTSSQELK